MNRRAALALLGAGVIRAFGQDRTPDVPYVPTPQEVVDGMLKLGSVREGDVLFDLGCGDGRIVVTAAKRYSITATGIDIDPERIAEANQNAKQHGVADRVKFVEADLFQTDLSKASVVTLYLLPSVNMRLRPKLWRELKPGSRVVSHAFDMEDWKPTKVEEVNGRRIYLWLITGKESSAAAN